MAVTINGNVIRMTAAADEVAMPLWIKSIRWDGATTAGHALQLVESSLGDVSNVLMESTAAGANHQEEWLVERLFMFGLEANTMTTGELWVKLMDVMP